MKIGAIIQARMESERLPGKAMSDIEGKPILAHIVESVQQVVPDIFIATTKDSPEIIAWATSKGIPCTADRYKRNVLDTFYVIASEYDLEHIVRVTGDNPLIRPGTIKDVVDFYFAGGYAWAANCRLKVTYPVGDDVEVFSRRCMDMAWRYGSSAYEKEHVTPYLYWHPELYKVGVLENKVDESHLRWTVDTAEDLERVRKIYCAQGERKETCLT